MGQEEAKLAAAGAQKRQPSHVRMLWDQVVAARGLMVRILLASLLLNVLGLATPRFTQAIFDSVVPQGDLPLLTQLVFALSVVTAVQIGLAVWRRLALVRLSYAIDRAMLGAICSHLLAVPTQFFKERRVGDLVARFQDQGHVRHLFTGALVRGGIDSLMVVIYIVVMLAYDVGLTCVVLVPLLAFGGFTFLMGTMLKHSHRGLQEAQGAYEAHLTEVFTGIDLVKGMGLEVPAHARWAELFEVYLKRCDRVNRLRQVLESGRTAIQFVSTVALFWYGAILVVGGVLTTGELVAFSLYAGQALPPLLSVIALSNDWQQARASLERMQDVLVQPPEPAPQPETCKALSPLQGLVEFDAVRFSYSTTEGREILGGISFALHPGECVAVVGRSGSGKTTLARLLLGLYQPTAGRILIDGHDLRELDLRAYRRQAAIVLQENVLLSGTLAANIALGDAAPDGSRVVWAAEQAGAHAFIAALPQGYATVIGEWGMTLSVGERQRVSLARALYRDPRILILDEPTSALDPATELAVLVNLERAMAGRTTLLIAHKLATVRAADRILVLQDGLIVEEGTDADLLVRHGSYAALTAGVIDG